MPGWSPEIANEFIRLACRDGRGLDQLQLQQLVYITHGWCLAFYDEPLTGDRAEAWDFGPMYRRLADCFAPYGRDLISREITRAEAFPDLPDICWENTTTSELDEKERQLIEDIYRDYAFFGPSELTVLTCKDDGAWAQVFAGGAGRFRDISHDAVRTQFVELRRKYEEDEGAPDDLQARS